MSHPCASPNPPSWCNKKRKKRKGGLSASPSKKRAGHKLAAMARNPKAHGFKQVAKAVCVGRKGRLKKGCIRGSGKFKGMVFKKRARGA